MSKFTKELVQELINKFTDTSVSADDVYVQFDTDSPNFFNKVAIRDDTVNPELFTIRYGVYRREDGMGYMNCIFDKNKDEIIRYLTSAQGIELIEKQLTRLLEKVIYMD